MVRVQSIHVDLLRADAVATNAFLVGGLESAEPAPATRAPSRGVAAGIAEAAAAQPADGNALGALDQRVQTYAALVEQARSNNRLGLPVGAQYLTQASAGLRADALPIVDAPRRGQRGPRPDDGVRPQQLERSAARRASLPLIGLVALAVWLARRTTATSTRR